MSKANATRKKAASRKGGEQQLLSTSEARANFAEALETAQHDTAIIGFGRYGRTVAALVPVEAVYMLAGLTDKVTTTTRQRIKKQASSFVASAPVRAREEAPVKKPAPAKKRKSGKGM